MPALTAISFRFLIAGTILLIFLAVKNGLSEIKLNNAELKTTIFLGIFMSGAGMGTSALSTKVVPIGVASLVVASMPMWVAFFRFLEKDHPSKATLFGLVFGFLGIALVMLPGKTNPRPGATGESVLFWCLVVMLGTISWAFASHRSTRMVTPKNPFVSSAYQSLFGGVGLFIGGQLTGEKVSDFIDGTPTSYLAWTYLIFIGSLVGFSTYVWLLNHTPISLVSTYTFMNPIVAILLGKFIFGDKTDTVVIIGGSIVLIAVMILIASESKKVKFTEAEHL